LSNKLANFLIDRGYGKGDFIGICLLNCPQWPIAYWAIIKTGAIAVSLNPMFKAKELSFQINDSGIKAVIAQDQLYPLIDGLPTSSNLNDVIITSVQDLLPENPTMPLLDMHKIAPRTYDGATSLKEVLNTYQSASTGVKTNLDDLAYICYTGGTPATRKDACIPIDTYWLRRRFSSWDGERGRTRSAYS